jgi:DNA-binding transcriptional LysR family regulator
VRLFRRHAPAVRAARGQTGLVRLGYTVTASYDTVPALLDACHHQHPGLKTDPGLRHLSLLDGRGFTLVPATVGTNPPGGAVIIPLADNLPSVELELLWRNDADSPAIGTILSTAQALAASRGWTSDADRAIC